MTQIAIELPCPRRARFDRADSPRPFQITERDVEIVRQVAGHRFLRSTHISRLLDDGSHKKILERLTVLYHAGYLDRPRAQLEYHVRGGGSAPLVYALGNCGAQLLIARDGLERVNLDWARKNHQSGREFILHTLAVADFRVALAVACRTRDNIFLRHPAQLLATLPDETRASRSPWGMRIRAPHQGAMHEIAVLPDYVFALHFADGKRRPFVVECDRGTMPIERSTLDQTSMLRKFLGYEAARQQRMHTARYGWQNFRVLIVAPTVERADNMRAVLTRTPQLKASPLFLFTDHPALIQSSDMLKHQWLDANGASTSLISGIRM